MDINTIKRVAPIAVPMLAGAVVGGVIGYFFSSLVINQLLKRSEEWEENNVWVHERELETGAHVVPHTARKMDYTQFAKEKGELNELVRPYVSSVSEGTNTRSDKIYVISVEEYDINRATNKEPVAFYKDDNTFCNNNEEIIDDPVSLFGPNVHLHFGEQSEDPDIVYVRNDNNGCDYEITQIHNSYAVLILGQPEEIKAPKRTRRGNVKKAVPNDNEDTEDEQEA
jgi:hypothetical protein